MANGITYDYKVGLKDQISEALKPVFGPELPDQRYKDIYIGFEYPMTQVHYPAIYLTYNEGPIRNVGVGNFEDSVDINGVPHRAKHFYFEGSVNFNILALNPVDRDNLSAVLMNLLLFADQIPAFNTFYDKLQDAKYLQLQLNTDIINPGGEQVGDTPWGSEDERIYGAQYTVPIIGEFFSDPATGDLIEISQVELYPYRDDQPAPW